MAYPSSGQQKILALAQKVVVNLIGCERYKCSEIVLGQDPGREGGNIHEGRNPS